MKLDEVRSFDMTEICMFSGTFLDGFLAEKRNDHLNEDISDEDDTIKTPASPIPSQSSCSPSSSPSPLANMSHTPPQQSMPAWDMCKTMCLAWSR